MKYTEIATNDKNGTQIPKGKYLAQIKEATEAESKKGIPMIKLKLKIVEGEFKNKTIFDQISFNCKRPRLLAKAIGIIKGDEKEFELEQDKIKNRLVWIQVEEEAYSGGVTSKVAFDGYGAVKPAKVAEVLRALKEEVEEPEDMEDEEEMTEEELQALDEMYKNFSM